MKGDAFDLGREILKGISQFDFMRVDRGRELVKDDANHQLVTEETFDLPNEYLVKSFLNPKRVNLSTYWCVDENNIFYVLTTTIGKKCPLAIREAFMCVPLSGSK